MSFLVLSRATDDLRVTGWVGTVLAAVVCVAYLKKLMSPHPILLGINLFMVAITPLIEVLFLAGNSHAAGMMIANIDSLVLGSVFATGLYLTLFSRNGFLTYKPENAQQARRHAAVLLTISAAGIAWSLLAGGNHLVTLALPLMLLFGLLQLLRAGAADRQSNSGAALVVAQHPPASETVI
ncbi:hypothetical protein [Ruegeria arenilitoris]|uniref:hypothetical protein n=1 Tax=Ruegeria arenilitoris TaxID=1173585 RepID=UPI00147FC8CA|nr:hypothetical protein [Ruegeria arenilitoris]